jgi:hypothetical protein
VQALRINAAEAEAEMVFQRLDPGSHIYFYRAFYAAFGLGQSALHQESKDSHQRNRNHTDYPDHASLCKIREADK